MCVDCDHTVLDKFVNDCCKHYENMPVHEVMNSVWYDNFYGVLSISTVILQHFTKSCSEQTGLCGIKIAAISGDNRKSIDGIKNQRCP